MQALKRIAFIGKIENLAQAARQTIAEVKVPVRATVEAIADTAGGTHPVINIETKKLGDVITAMEWRALNQRFFVACHRRKMGGI